MKVTDDLVLACTVCGREFRGRRAPQARGGHMKSHADRALAGANGTPKPKRTRRASAEFIAELEVAPVVQRLFPKGIPTDDPVALVRDLKLISDLRERFVR